MFQFARWCRRYFAAMFMTADDNSPCAVRVFGIGFALISTAIFMWLAIHTVIDLRQPFDYAGFGGGLTALWGVVGLSIGLKSFSERVNKQ